MTTQDAFVADVRAMVTGIQKQAPNIVFVYASQTYTAQSEGDPRSSRDDEQEGEGRDHRERDRRDDHADHERNDRASGASNDATRDVHRPRNGASGDGHHATRDADLRTSDGHRASRDQHKRGFPDRAGHECSRLTASSSQLTG